MAELQVAIRQRLVSLFVRRGRGAGRDQHVHRRGRNPAGQRELVVRQVQRQGMATRRALGERTEHAVTLLLRLDLDRGRVIESAGTTPEDMGRRALAIGVVVAVAQHVVLGDRVIDLEVRRHTRIDPLKNT